MSRTLFDQTLAPHKTNTRPIGTLSLSILLHAGALAIVLALQFTASIQGLAVGSPLTAFVAPPAPPPAPAPPARPATASHAPDPRIAPTVQPDAITTEPEVIARPPAPDVPVGPTVGLPGDPAAIIPRGGLAVLNPPPPPLPVRVGGDIRAPARVVYVPPVYPSIAVAARVEGEVVLEATIDETGTVRDVTVRQSIALLDRAAIDAVSKWRYSPTRLNGQAVPVIMLVRVKFSLK
jgi:protein TonB